MEELIWSVANAVYFLHVEMLGRKPSVKVYLFLMVVNHYMKCICFVVFMQVLDLISSDNLNVPSEEEVYRAVLSWVKHDIDGRRQHVPWVILIPSHLTLFLSAI